MDEKANPVIAGLNSHLAAANQKITSEIADARHNLEILERNSNSLVFLNLSLLFIITFDTVNYIPNLGIRHFWVGRKSD